MTETHDPGAYLAGYGVSLATISEAELFSDGSLSMIYVHENGQKYHLGVEFNPPLGRSLANYLRENDVQVRGKFRP
ncbi:hypothetical protein [Sphingomonas pruni]|uniref:hypothetical protein n=1 Tax=Sphingomonas pruni TaxID=40683 RepID=UPI000A429D7F|nr:hypothetical protein [Sphingomonas pruni]